MLTFGPPKIYVPICKPPRHYLYCTGPIGYERVEKVKQTPLLISGGGQRKDRKP